MSLLSKALGLDAKKRKAQEAAKSAAAAAAADPNSPQNTTARINAAASTAGQNANTAESTYLQQATQFNPTQAVKDYSTAAYDATSQNIRDQLNTLAGDDVNQGRINTGFYDEDRGQVVNRNLADYNSKVANAAYSATGYQLANQQGLASNAENQENTYMSTLRGNQQYQEEQAADAADRARKKKSGIGSLIGGVLGGTIGSIVPGLGTATGATLGAGLGGGF